MEQIEDVPNAEDGRRCWVIKKGMKEGGSEAKSANAAVPDEATGWWVLHPLESVLWTHATCLPVSVCVRLS